MDAGLLKPGAVLNSTYQIEELVGEGGTGEVYRAINTASQRTVAIKILKEQFSQDPKFIDLMRRELLHNVSDDAVVRYYDLLRTAEDQGGLYFLVMDYIAGPPLSDLMRKGPVDVDTLMVMAKHVTQGLAACHRASIFHRDISPDNIILRDGDPTQSVLIDFGIAKDVNPDAKTVVGGGFAGKYEYAAPEQLDGIADSRSDIYSFGMTLLAAARGESPKLGTSFLEIVKAKHTEVDTMGVGEPLRGIIDAMVRPAPEDRPQTAAELLRLMGGGPAEPGIESLLTEESESPETGARANPTTVVPGAQKKKGGMVGALVALLVVGGAGAFFTVGPGAEMLSGGGLEEANPYLMTIGYDGDDAEISGNVPSAEAAEKLAKALSTRLSDEVNDDDLTPADGAPNDAWMATVTALAGELSKLESGELKFRDDQITFQGDASSESVKSQVERTARTIAGNGDYRIALVLKAPAPVVAPPRNDTAEAERAAREAAERERQRAEAESTRLAEQERLQNEEREAARLAEAERLQREADEQAENERQSREDEANRLADTERTQEAEQRAEAERQQREAQEAERLAEVERQQREAEAAERRAEAERQAESQRLAEEERQAEAERLADSERVAEAQRAAEVARIAEAERLAEAERRAEAERLAEDERTAAAEREAARVAALAVDPRPAPPVDQRLRLDDVREILDPMQSCGPLSVRSSSSRGFGKTESIRVRGDLATVEDEGKLRDDLKEIADGRRIDTSGISILNPSVCMIKHIMPPRNSGPASLLYNSAKTGALVQGDALKPDDQAVVSFVVPDDLDGNVYAFIVDNEFNAFHIYPMPTRPKTLLAEIGDVEDGKRRLQLSWPPAEGSRSQPVLAFTEPYGIAMMFVVVTDKDTSLFPHVRAGGENVRELAPVLEQSIKALQDKGGIVAHIQRFILVDED